jgi:hypothetical protein
MSWDDRPGGYLIMRMSRFFGGGKRRLKTDEQAIVDAASSLSFMVLTSIWSEDHLHIIETSDLYQRTATLQGAGSNPACCWW